MDFAEAESVFRRAIEEDVALCDNMSLLRKFISSWMETVLEDEKSIPILLRWYKRTFFEHETYRSKGNCCILAVITLETLLESNVDLVIYSGDLFSQCVLPLHEMITCHQCGEQSDPSNINNEIIISWYKIHCKLSENVQHVKYVKKYGLWKAPMQIYVKSNKFSLPIQNICSEYLSNILACECMPEELHLLLDVTTTNAKIIKDHVEAGCFNDQILFRSLRILNHVLLKNFSRLNGDAFGLVSRKCHQLSDASLQIAFKSKNSSIVKYALFVHVLLKYCFVAGDEAADGQFLFEKLIQAVGDTLVDSRFLKYLPEIFSTLKKVFCCSSFQNLWIQIQVFSCNLYSKQLSLSVDLPSHEYQETSDILSSFFEKYRIQLSKSQDLQEIVDSILKLMSTDNSHIFEGSKNYLIGFLNSILKSFIDFDGWLSGDLCNFLINSIHSIGALWTGIVAPCHNFDDILETTVGICRLDLQSRMDIKIAAFNLCRSMVNQKPELSAQNLEVLKQMMMDNLRDSRWEMRDCVLELLADLLPMISKNNNHIICNTHFFEILFKTLFDDESYVRASAYKVLSVLVLLPIDQPPDYESLLSQTLAQFPKETEGNVRVDMIMFVKCIWRNHEINSSLLRDVYEIIYLASTMDLYEEVRINGMLFWQNLVQSYPSTSEEMGESEFFERLASVGCLQAVTNALEDEYDLQVVNIALNILNLFRSLSTSLSNNSIRLDKCEETVSTELPRIEGAAKLTKCANFIASINRPSHYSSGKDFLNKYKKVDIEQLRNDKLIPSETLNLENLIHYFKKVTFDASINEKDCY